MNAPATVRMSTSIFSAKAPSSARLAVGSLSLTWFHRRVNHTKSTASTKRATTAAQHQRLKTDRTPAEGTGAEASLVAAPLRAAAQR